MKKMVSPYLKDESRRMYKLGHDPGMLSRQPYESMREYSDRRVMWYKSLRQLDPEAYVGDAAPADLLLRFCGLN